MVKAQRWVLQHKPERHVELGDDGNSTFKLESLDLADPKNGEVLLQHVYLSNDPAQRGWIDAHADPRRLYQAPCKIGEVVATLGSIAKVLKTGGNTQLSEGDLVQVSNFGWQTHKVVPSNAVERLEPIEGQPLSIFIGALGGSTSLTAWFALNEILEMKGGEKIVISGAAGGVGSVAVQLAKHVLKSKLVVGLAGSKEKCDYIRKLGCDVAINYRESDWIKQLHDATPDFVECFLDNVGGEILTQVLPRVATYGCVAAVGSISGYNSNEHAKEVGNWFEVIQCRLTIRGFIVADYHKRFPEARAALREAYEAGHLQLEGSETVVKAKIEQVPEIWTRLFSKEKSNQGKLVTQLVEI